MVFTFSVKNSKTFYKIINCPLFRSFYTVKIGQHNLANRYNNHIPIAKILIHNNFTSDFKNDIALIKLRVGSSL